MRKHSFALLSACLFVFMLFAVHGAAQESKMRTWTSTQGSTIEAELVKYENGVATLRNQNGRTLSVKITQLSRPDQDFLNQLSAGTDSAVPSGKPPYEIVCVMVGKPLPSKDENHAHMLSWSVGTTISLLVRSDDLTIIGLDDKASKMISFVDEKKNDLMKSAQRPQQMGMNMFITFEPSSVSCHNVDYEGKWAIVQFSAPNPPAAGSQFVTLKGNIALRAGTGSIVTEHKDIDLSGKGQFKAGNAVITVKKRDSNSGMRMTFMGVSDDISKQIALEAKGDLDSIKKFSFFNSQGEEIESRSTGSMSGGGNSSLYFELVEDVETITIKTDAYEKLETIRIPVSLETGIGF